MDSDSIYMIIAMIILTAMSAFFSGTETAFTTFNRIKIKNMAQDGNKRAALALTLADDFDRLLTTVLIGNNIVNIALSSIGTVLFTTYFHANGPVVSTAVITVVVLIFGEISPKSIAREKADSFVLSVSGTVNILSIVFRPLVFLFSRWKLLLKKIFKTEETAVMTEEELITIVEEAEQDGGINQDESDLIRSAIEFTDVSVDEILTPRVEVIAISSDSAIEEIAQTFLDSGYSRLPVYGDDIDDVIGLLHEKDFFMAYYKGIDDIREVLQKPVFISGHVKISNLLQILKNSKCHMAIVVDEFGGMTGLVTMEDIIEELIGDVWDEHDEIEEDFIEQPDGSCLVDCSADLDELFEKYDIYPDEDENLPQTVNGWLLMEFGNFPDLNDILEYKGYLFEITKIDQKKIEEVRISPIGPKSDQEDEDVPDDAL